MIGEGVALEISTCTIINKGYLLQDSGNRVLFKTPSRPSDFIFFQ
jgi:hypothetical protein